MVINGLMVRGGAHLGLRAETARSSVELLVSLGHQGIVETGGCEGVLSMVKGGLIENLAGLLGNGLLQVVVVYGDAGHVALVAWDHARLLPGWDLNSKYIRKIY